MFFLDRFALGYILFLFPTASVLLLLSRPITAHLARNHWIAYWLINALWFFIAWQVANVAKNSTYLQSPGRRKVLGAIALPAALLVANSLFLYLLEGPPSTIGLFTPLFLILGFVACATGFVATRSEFRNNWQQKGVQQAKRIQKGTQALAGFLAAAVGGSIALESLRGQYVKIWNSTFLFWGSVFVASGLFFTLVIYPWLIVNEMQGEIDRRTPQPIPVNSGTA